MVHSCHDHYPAADVVSLGTFGNCATDVGIGQLGRVELRCSREGSRDGPEGKVFGPLTRQRSLTGAAYRRSAVGDDDRVVRCDGSVHDDVSFQYESRAQAIDSSYEGGNLVRPDRPRTRDPWSGPPRLTPA